MISKPEVKEVLNEGISTIDKRLHALLNEEHGINDEVVKAFCTEIEKYVVDNKSVFLNTPNGKYVYHTFDFEGEEACFTFYVFKCKDREEEAKLLVTEPKAANAYSVYLSRGIMLLITIPVVFVGEKLDTRKLYDDLQHEVSHIFQQHSSGETYKESEYNYATSFLYSANKCERILARIVYLCYPPEQDAFVNGMYGYIMKALYEKELPIDKSKISAYQELQNLYTAYDFVQRNRDTEEMKKAIIQMQNKGVKWNIKKYLSRASEGIKEFERKIMRILVKCQNDAVTLGYNVQSRKPGIWLF